MIYVGTFARTPSPELRLGYIVVPPGLADTLRAMKWLTDRGSSPLEQRALAALMESGMYERAQRRMARSLSERRALLIAALQSHFPAMDLRWSGSGAHLFLTLPALAPDGVRPLLTRCQERGVRLYPGSPYYLLPPRNASLLCGFEALTAKDIESGVERFAAAYFSLGT